MANMKLGATSPHLELQLTDVVSLIWVGEKCRGMGWAGRVSLGVAGLLLALTSWPCPGQPQPPWLYTQSPHSLGTAQA